MTTQDGNLYIGYLNESPLPVLDWTYTLYLDTDSSAATGFQSGILGGDYMIQDTGLYQYSGTGSDWTWTLVGNLRVGLNGAQVEIEVSLAEIGSPTSFDFECDGENAALGSNDGIDIAFGQFQVVALQASPAGARPLLPQKEFFTGTRTRIKLPALQAGPGVTPREKHR